MQTHIGHIQFMIRPENVSFYRDLMPFLGWNIIHTDDEMVGVGGPNDSSLWFMALANDASNDYDGVGMNHLGIGAESQSDVDTVANYLKEKGVVALFDTPCHRPEFSAGDDQTYYQVMFETPDRILIEVVYTGPKSA